MLFFINDYSDGMHENILNALIKTNGDQQVGYGNDEHTKNACDIIRKVINKPNADVHLLVGGTQTNKIALAAFMRPFEAVISSNLGHIAVHETGAIEATGHKVIEMYSPESKLTPELIEEAVRSHFSEHMVAPKVVYVSNSTELGKIYTKAELTAISETCKKHNLYLYLDGARLATALTSEKNDLTLEDIASLCDAFYIGGTKNGALMGEALIILNDDLKSGVRHIIKQNGALLAKGRFLGIQFEELFKDNLYFDIAKHTNVTGKMLADVIRKTPYKFVSEPETNLIFVIIPNEIHEKLKTLCHYEVDGFYDENHTICRFVTSFKTKIEDIYEFEKVLLNL